MVSCIYSYIVVYHITFFVVRQIAKGTVSGVILPLAAGIFCDTIKTEGAISDRL